MNAIGQLLRNNKDSLWQFIRFGIVGGLGVLVNMGALIACRKLFPLLWPSAGVPEGEGVWLAIPGTEYNIRWYHVMSTIAFLLANLFNFQLNRWWTFKSHKLAGWFREYWPFLIVGLVALAVGQVIITALMHPHSPRTTAVAECARPARPGGGRSEQRRLGNHPALRKRRRYRA